MTSEPTSASVGETKRTARPRLPLSALERAAELPAAWTWPWGAAAPGAGSGRAHTPRQAGRVRVPSDKAARAAGARGITPLRSHRVCLAAQEAGRARSPGSVPRGPTPATPSAPSPSHATCPSAFLLTTLGAGEVPRPPALLSPRCHPGLQRTAGCPAGSNREWVGRVYCLEMRSLLPTETRT